jgi:CxxC motif-containing protein
MDKKKYICIACPIGCHLDIEAKDGKVINIEGNKCKRGIDYAINEYTDPKRMLTVTCRVNSKLVHRVPVKTTEAISKKYIKGLIEELYKLNLTTPLKVGEKVIENYKNTNVDIVITRNLEY